MATIIFTEAPADPAKGFRVGHPQSVFQNNVTFTVTGVKFGNYATVKDDGSKVATKYAEKAQSILFTTSVGEDLPLSRLLNKRRLIYDENGRARTICAASFAAPLLAHIETLGRRPDDPSFIIGDVKTVAEHALKFFDGKTLVVVEFDGYGRDKDNKLVPLLSPAVQFQFKES